MKKQTHESKFRALWGEIAKRKENPYDINPYDIKENVWIDLDLGLDKEENYCPACNECKLNCNKCPLIWTNDQLEKRKDKNCGEMFCIDSDTLYTKWRNSNSKKTASKYAKQISKMTWHDLKRNRKV